MWQAEEDCKHNIQSVVVRFSPVFNTGGEHSTTNVYYSNNFFPGTFSTTAFYKLVKNFLGERTL